MEKNTGRLLKQASNQLGRRFDQFAKRYDLTGTQLSIIDFLSQDRQKAYVQRDIELEFNIQRSTTTVLLQRMEKKGLIYRQTAPADGRQKSVHLTQKALDVAKAAQLYFQNQEKALDQHFSADERAIFEAILIYYISGNEEEPCPDKVSHEN